MPISDRDYVRGNHPPSCTCKECTDRRLKKLTNQSYDKSRKETSRKTKPASVGSNIPPVFLQTTRGKPLQRIWRTIPLSVHKLFLSLLIIAGLVDIIRRGSTLFTHQTDPIKNTIVFLVEVGLWFWIISILRSRRYKYRKPKFKLVFITIIAITLVCAFAGIEPPSSYKDEALNSISAYLKERQAIREAVEIAEAEELAVEEARMKAEALAQADAERKAEEEEEKQTLTSLSRLIYQLVNEERENHGLNSLQISSTLTSLAEEHSKKMVDYDYFSHDRMPNTRPFDWNLQPGFGRGENISMTPSRLLIPGPFLTSDQLANEVVQGWMNSPSHRQNILESRFIHTGIGISKKDTYYYITQMFEGQW